MFPTSSQRRYWTFENEEKIEALRIKHNQEFVERHRYQLGLSVCANTDAHGLGHCKRRHWRFTFLWITGWRLFGVFPGAERWTNAIEKLWIESEGFLPSFRTANAEMYCGDGIPLFQTFLFAQLTDGLPSERDSVSVSTCPNCLTFKTRRPLICVFPVAVPHVPIYRAKQRSSTCPLINSLATSEATESRRWISFCQTNCCWCNSSTTIWPFTIHFAQSKGFWLTSKREAPCRIRIVWEPASMSSSTKRFWRTPVCCTRHRNWHLQPFSIRPAKNKRIWMNMLPSHCSTMHQSSSKNWSMPLKVSWRMYNWCGPSSSCGINHWNRFLNLFPEIRLMVRELQLPQRDIVREIEKKLERCRNQENNPDSEMYATRIPCNFQNFIFSFRLCSQL